MHDTNRSENYLTHHLTTNDPLFFEHQPLLSLATIHRHPGTVKALLSSGILPNNEDYNRRFDIVEAANLGDLQTLKRLWSAGALVSSIKVRARTGLQSACEHGHTRCVEFLLHVGASAKIGSGTRDSPLCLAITHAQRTGQDVREMLELLIPQSDLDSD